jgi:lipid A disaccharide synthetase
LDLKDVEVLFDGPKELGVMGFGLELLRALPNGYMRLNQTERWVHNHKIDVLLTVDCKAFSFRLHRNLQRSPRGGPLLMSVHVCAPSSVWAFKSAELGVNDLDYLCTLLPFEKAYWKPKKPGKQVVFVGYPAVETLLDYVGAAVTSPPVDFLPLSGSLPSSAFQWAPHEVPLNPPGGRLPRLSKSTRERAKQELLSALGVPGWPVVLALAPGSRLSEVRASFRLMERAVARFQERSSVRVLPVVLAAATVRPDLEKQSPFLVVSEEEWKLGVFAGELLLTQRNVRYGDYGKS